MEQKMIFNLIDQAIKAREFSYSPYSKFKVGAALLTKNGKIFPGCNIESAALGPTNCAERTAFFSAISQGERDFSAIAIVGSKQGEPLSDLCAPCGVCRQVMMEFCDYESFKIILGKQKNYKVFTLKELMPYGFGPKDLK